MHNTLNINEKLISLLIIELCICLRTFEISIPYHRDLLLNYNVSCPKSSDTLTQPDLERKPRMFGISQSSRIIRPHLNPAVRGGREMMSVRELSLEGFP